MDGSVLEEKSSFKMLGLTFSSKLDWGSYIISVAKTAFRKTGAFFYSEVALYLYKSSIQPCMEYLAMSGLVLLVAAWNCWISYIQKRICRTVGPSLLPLLNSWLIIKMQPA